MQFYKTAMDLSRDITKDLLAKLSDTDKVPDCPAYFVRYIRTRILNLLYVNLSLARARNVRLLLLMSIGKKIRKH